jgi:tyrosyl-tRNA synthetase
LGKPAQVCLTLPLLEGTDGVQKMSKSYGNYIGLTDEPADMFGKVMSIPDELMVKYFRLCTGLAVDDVDAVEAGLAAGELHPNAEKRRLAREVVGLYHGDVAAEEAEAAFDRVFKQHQLPEDIAEFAVALPDEVYLPGVLAEAGLVSSASDGRRMIDQGGVRVDGEVLDSGSYSVTRARVEGRVVQVGKRRFARIVASAS